MRCLLRAIHSVAYRGSQPDSGDRFAFNEQKGLPTPDHLVFLALTLPHVDSGF
jgi:hypothetical protein